jgi:hypothetical protein
MLAIVGLTLVGAAACAPGPNPVANTPEDGGGVAGFWHGLWHGFIVLFTFIFSLFTDSVRVYEVHNNGNWYNFGFLLGVMIFFGGGGNGACRGKRGKRG